MLADFMAEFTPSEASVGICQVTVRRWKVYMDGVSNVRGLGAGKVLVLPESVRLEKSLRMGFQASNNKVEYEALIARLRVTQKLRAKEVEVFSNSRLVVSQIDGTFKARDRCMSQYLKLFRSLQANFQKVSVVRVHRSQNGHANSLAMLASFLDDCIP